MKNWDLCKIEKLKYITVVYIPQLESVKLMVQEHYDIPKFDDTVFFINTLGKDFELNKDDFPQHRKIYYNFEHAKDTNLDEKFWVDEYFKYFGINEVWSFEPNCEIFDTDLGIRFMPLRYTSLIKKSNHRSSNNVLFDLGLAGVVGSNTLSPRRNDFFHNYITGNKYHFSIKILNGHSISEMKDEFNNCRFILDSHRNYRHNMQNQVRIFEHICLGHTVLSEKSDYNIFPGLIYEWENMDELENLINTVEPQDFSEKYKEMTYSDEAYESYRNAILHECYHKWAAQYFDKCGIKRYDLINRLIKKFNYTNYLEIGVSTGDNFIKVDCENKTYVSPEQHGYTTHQMTSDEFFAQLPDDAKFDIIFIDGLHLWEQCYKDIENSLKHLTPNGIIVCHDMNPLYEMYNSRKPYNAYFWNGDVWKAFVKIRTERSDIFTCMIEDCDFGLGFICFGEQPLLVLDKPFEKLSFTDDFSKNKHYLMNSVKINDFFEKTNI